MADLATELTNLNAQATELLAKYNGAFEKLDEETQNKIIEIQNKAEELKAEIESANVDLDFKLEDGVLVKEDGSEISVGNALKLGGENITSFLTRKPDFDSGWFLIEAGSKHYTLQHDLGTNILTIKTMLRASDSDKIFYNADNLQSMIHLGENSDTKYNGFSIEEIDANSISINTANHYVLATDNSVQYGDTQYSNGNALTSAYIRVLIWKVEV